MSGYNPTTASINQVLQRLSEYGEIVEYRSALGNWTFVRFGSPVSAERSCNSVMLLEGNVVVTVTQMSWSIARKLNVSLTTEGSIKFGANISEEAASSNESGLHRRKAYLDTSSAPNHSSIVNQRNKFDVPPREHATNDNIYILPKRRKGICERLYEYFWSFN